jgi:cell division septum initiation protein DivIVA
MQEQNQRRSQPHKEPCPPPPNNDDKCKEKDTVTQKTINTERKIYCSELDSTAGIVYQAEENYSGWKEIKKRKKCLFVWTEKNYQAFRNFQLTTDVSLLQFNDSIKNAITGFLKDNKTLSDSLRDVLKKVKETRTKIIELKLAGYELKHCTEDVCNCTQWGILTNEWSENCKDKRPEVKRPPECDNVKDKFKKLTCIAEALALDADSLLKAAADVIGIQVFSNIGTLEGLQKKLDENTKALDKHLQEVVKKDQDDLKKVQDDFVKAVQEFSKSKASLYTKRSLFKGLLDTVAFFCCPVCGCVDTEHDCEERLRDCKEQICEICDEVKDTFCTEPGQPSQQDQKAY